MSLDTHRALIHLGDRRRGRSVDIAPPPVALAEEPEPSPVAEVARRRLRRGAFSTGCPRARSPRQQSGGGQPHFQDRAGHDWPVADSHKRGPAKLNTDVLDGNIAPFKLLTRDADSRASGRNIAPFNRGRVAFPTLRPPRLRLSWGSAPWTKRGKRTTCDALVKRLWWPNSFRRGAGARRRWSRGAFSTGCPPSRSPGRTSGGGQAVGNAVPDRRHHAGRRRPYMTVRASGCPPARRNLAPFNVAPGRHRGVARR